MWLGTMPSQALLHLSVILPSLLSIPVELNTCRRMSSVLAASTAMLVSLGDALSSQTNVRFVRLPSLNALFNVGCWRGGKGNRRRAKHPRQSADLSSSL